MGCNRSKDQTKAANGNELSDGKNDGDDKSSKLKVHTTISDYFDEFRSKSKDIHLEDATDEQIVAEISRRKIDIRSQITMVFFPSRFLPRFLIIYEYLCRVL